MVEFGPRESLDLSEYRTVGSGHGTLGLITLNNDVFICVVTDCLNRPDYDNMYYGREPNPYPGSSFSTDDVDYGGGYDQGDSAAEHPFAALKKLLSNGFFYYSVDFDLTSRLQHRANDDAKFDIGSLDEGLLWNSYMIEPLLQFRSRLVDHERDALDQSQILTSVIRGFVKTITVPPASAPLRRQVSNLPSSLTVISRLSARRAGTRFNSRGIDDDGNVANFVETETIFWSPAGVCFSYVQIRGSVPIFWESSSSLIPGQQKIQITRPAEATQPAFDKHFEMLELAYGGVHVVNLLTEEKPGEKELSDRFHYHIDRSSLQRHGEKGHESEHDLIRETRYDFHVETRGAEGYEAARMIRRYLEDSADGFAYFLSEIVKEDARLEGAGREQYRHPVVVLQQEGVFRTNCLDCLDRTNLVQSMISQMALESFLSHRGETGSSDFWMRHSSLWADNGDTLSKIYAGTGALKSSFTRHGKMSFAGAIADVRKSATRLYVNNFADKARQNTIDLLLGRLMGQAPVNLFDPINDYVTAELHRQAATYSSTRPVHIWVGTFNLNGKTSGLQEDLSPWLHARSQSMKEHPELIAIGFQEIVELSPQQIMATDPSRRQAWEEAVQRCLNEHAKSQGLDDYVLLRSAQLVGAALLIFVRVSILPHIKNVEGSIKKTGLSGIAGNKGAVAIRLEFASTSICFVTAHLAAGFANYEERNRDYRTISHGLRFQKNRSISDHDTIIWLGDFNYRIGLSDERARRLVAARDLETLYENDQLNLQMVAGLAFKYYSESRITFLPTYKFNLNSDDYDTSEKARIPAWTDRILRKGTNLKQIDYNCAPLRFSDHRPVFATFECMITIVDEKLRAQLSAQIYGKRREELGTDHAVLGHDADSDEDADLLGYDAIEPGLPPASSDRRKWWLDNGLPSRSTLTPPQEGMVPNPKRPSNPWSKSTGEPEWVHPKDIKIPARGQKPQPPPPRRRTLITPAWEGETKRPASVNSATDAGTGSPDLQKHLIPPGPRRRISNTTTLSPSRASSISAASSTSQTLNKKPAPPIPKKPTALTSPNSTSAPSPSTSPLPEQPSTTPPRNEPPFPSPRHQFSASSSTTTSGRAKPLIPSRVPTTSTTDRPTHPLPPSQPSSSRHNSPASSQSPTSTFQPTLPRRTNTSSSLASYTTADSEHRTLSPAPPPSVPSRAKIPATTTIPPPKRTTRYNPSNTSEQDEKGPTLPPRRPQQQQISSSGTGLGLMDSGIEEKERGELGEWEVLKPGR
ncbi:putative synaptojanin 2 [Phaeomoniella chlamydospora]|uniref:phosphoinositide 5-phosphatase n=1 Tax=Phaeomoniella chlamydospora TaxID=158046 RepID=A0A0G2G0C7_PHACM|nr:putative synaptojanin 2 [Phaeomoniella chlamydospora]